jgi:hypothetical protein
MTDTTLSFRSRSATGNPTAAGNVGKNRQDA